MMLVVDQSHGPTWSLYCGDSAEVLAGIPDHSVDLVVSSPPFGALYVYSATERDLGNSRSPQQFWRHFAYISRELRRVMRPGRLVALHVAQTPAMLSRDGYIGLKNLRDETITHFEKSGFIFHGEITIDKDPQAQAIRTKSKALLFTQLHKDASWLRPALADYVVLMRAPGDNSVPILPSISNDEWIEWARPIWYGIRESDTLSVAEAREQQDERHICPLQLGTIERCIRLWSNTGETVLDPFNGIGSVGYVAIQHGRRYLGVELKPSYYAAAVKNLEAADRRRLAPDLFSALEASA
jgi:DNA modification methylase